MRILSGIVFTAQSLFYPMIQIGLTQGSRQTCFFILLTSGCSSIEGSCGTTEHGGDRFCESTLELDAGMFTELDERIIG
jgi:hypothetical protein